MRACLAIAALAAALVPQEPPHAQAEIDLGQLMLRASAWTTRFDDSLSGLLFRERYLQRVGTGAGTGLPPAIVPNAGALPRNERLLEANVFLLSVPSVRGFVVYRDVYRVNARDLADHTERLQKLLTDGSVAAREQARKLTDASARHNVPGFNRNINLPTMVYDYLARRHIRSLDVRVVGSQRIEGLDCTIVEFRESTAPTVVRGPDDSDVFGSGRFWIHQPSGAVPRAMAEFTTTRSKGKLEVRLELHETLKVWVPKQMTEVWTGGGRFLTGLATYDRFQRMNVATNEIMK